MHQPPVPLHAGDQRAQGVRPVAGPAGHDHLLAAAALGLGPAVRAAGGVGCVQPLGDHAFQVQAAGRLQHRVAPAVEVLHIADARGGRGVQHRLQPFLALGEGQGAQVLAPLEQDVEGVEDQAARLLLRQGELQAGEVRRAVLVQRHRLAVQHDVGQPRAIGGDLGEACAPVQALAGAKRLFAALAAELQPVAV